MEIELNTNLSNDDILLVIHETDDDNDGLTLVADCPRERRFAIKGFAIPQPPQDLA